MYLLLSIYALYSHRCHLNYQYGEKSLSLVNFLSRSFFFEVPYDAYALEQDGRLTIKI